MDNRPGTPVNTANGLWGGGMAQDGGGAGGPVRRERIGSTLVLLIDNPPVNALGHAVRAGLWDGIAAAEDDPAVRAVVIAAEGRTFPAGADISEFGQPPRAPVLPDLCSRIEDCAKPVVAAIQGTALGGGLELALAAHHRIAAPQARLGLPEVTLGLLPGGGGTQRLPRLVGPAAALEMMLTGRPVNAATALERGLVDRLAEGDLVEAALALAATADRRPTRDRDAALRDPGAWSAAVAAARKDLRGNRLPAPGRICDCVEAALLLPFAQGMAYERAAFLDLVDTPEAAALRHLFFAERRAGRVDGPRAPRIYHVLVLGAGTEGADMARALLQAGLRVTLADADQARLVPGLERIAAAQAEAVAEGRMTAAARDADWSRLLPALADETVADPEADVLVLAGAFAEMADPLPPLTRAAVRPGAPVITLGRTPPALPRAAGLLLVPPGSGGQGAEVLAGAETAPPTLAAAAALARALDRVPVIAQGPGIGAPVMAALGRAARHLARLHGVAPVEAALRGWGLMLPNLAQAGEGTAPAPPPDLIRRRLMGAMANAGLALLGTGAAQRPSDIDVAVVTGRGFPRWEGGPMHWAEGRGMLVLRADLQAWAAEAPDLWTPAPLIDRLIHDGTRLAALNDA